jgi:hypothetical protein
MPAGYLRMRMHSSPAHCLPSFPLPSPGLTIHEPGQPQTQPVPSSQTHQPEPAAQQPELALPSTWQYQPVLPQMSTGYWATPGVPVMYPQMPMQPIPSASLAETHPAAREDVGQFWASQRPLWAFWATFSFINFLFFLLLVGGVRRAGGCEQA